jgi:transposase
MSNPVIVPGKGRELLVKGGDAAVDRRPLSVRRDRILAFTAGVGSCVVALEACCGAHHLARRLSAQGHTVRLMSPEYVRAIP